MPSSRFQPLLAVTAIVLAVAAPVSAATAASASSQDATAKRMTGTDPGPVAPDATIEDGGAYWVGQTLASTDWRVDAVELQVRRGGSWAVVADRPVEAGRVVVETQGLDAGQYRLVSTDSGRAVSFRLRAQTIDAALADRDLTPDYCGASPNTTVSVRSNRSEYDLAVTSPDLDASTLGRVLPMGEPVDRDGDGTTDAVVVKDVAATTELTGNYSGVHPGNVTLAFAPVDAAANATVTGTINHVGAGPATFQEKVLEASVSGEVRIPMTVVGCLDRATVVVGSKDEPVSFAATVEDGNDDGNATLVWNTSGPQTAAAAFTTGNGTTLVDVTRRRPADDVANRSVQGAYELSLHYGNTTDAPETDLAKVLTAPRPSVEVESVRSPDLAEVDEEFQIAVALENAGDRTASTTVRVVRDGETVSSIPVEVRPGVTTSVQFSIEPDDAGTARYGVVAGDANATFAVEIQEIGLGTTTTPTSTSPVEPTVTTTTATRVDETDGSVTSSAPDATGMPGFGFAVASVALAACALLARTRR